MLSETGEATARKSENCSYLDMLVEIGENMGLANFPSDVRHSYRMLLPKFNALGVVIDEQKRNTRDILGILI